MPSKNTTTVVLTEKAQEIKEDLAPIFGLKNILSAGLVLMGKLSAEQQKAIIAEANSKNSHSSLSQWAIDDENAAASALTKPKRTRKARKSSKSA